MVLKNNLFKQIFKFGIVGVTAAIVNFIVVVGIVEMGLMSPLYANMVAFVAAFQVSYFGHRNWTFNETTATHSTAIPRLLVISITTFFANESLFYFFLNTFHFSYPLALFLVLAILPVATFAFGKFWIFR